jgi:hypothetical protein
MPQLINRMNLLYLLALTGAAALAIDYSEPPPGTIEFVDIAMMNDLAKNYAHLLSFIEGACDAGDYKWLHEVRRHLPDDVTLGLLVGKKAVYYSNSTYPTAYAGELEPLQVRRWVMSQRYERASATKHTPTYQ